MATSQKREETQTAPAVNPLEKKLDAVCATVRRLVKRAEQHWGEDLDQDGKVGSSRIAWLVVLALTCMSVMAANVLRDGWGTGENFGTFAVYGDAATDSATLVVDAVTADVTGDVTATTVSGAAATDEVLSMGYSTLSTDVTLTKGGSYFVTTGAAMTITLPDPATVLGKSLRIVVAGDGGDLTVNGALTSHYYVAGDGGATDSSAVLDDALDMIEIQAISTVLWGVLDQTGVSSYTTR